VLVIGAGALGQFALQFLRLVPEAGAELFVAVQELLPARVDRATQLGADAVLLDPLPGQALEVLGGPADVVLDFVGTDATLAQAAAAVAPGGIVVLIGEASGSMEFGFDSIPIEAWLTTVAWGSHEDLRDVVRIAENGLLGWNVEAVALADAADAHARLRSGDVDGRLVLVP
jgi:propanol-preferring alcohol dehydrogenase